jgi:hypothetical protein
MISEYHFDLLGKKVSILWLSILMGGRKCFDYLLNTPLIRATILNPISHTLMPTLTTALTPTLKTSSTLTTLLTPSPLTRTPLAPSDNILESVSSINDNKIENNIHMNDNKGAIKNDVTYFYNKNIINIFHDLWSHMISSLIGGYLREEKILKLMKCVFNLLYDNKNKNNLYDIDENNQNNLNNYNIIDKNTSDDNNIIRNKIRDNNNDNDNNIQNNDIPDKVYDHTNDKNKRNKNPNKIGDDNNNDDINDDDITLCPQELIRGLINKVYLNGEYKYDGNDAENFENNGNDYMKKITSMTLCHSHDKEKKSRDEGRHMESLFHICCRRGFVTLVEFLLFHGADVRSKDEDGYTPWGNSITRGHPRVTVLLGAALGDDDEVHTAVRKIVWEMRLYMLRRHSRIT